MNDDHLGCNPGQSCVPYLEYGKLWYKGIFKPMTANVNEVRIFLVQA